MLYKFLSRNIPRITYFIFALTETQGRKYIPTAWTPWQPDFLQLSHRRPSSSCFWPASFTFVSWSLSVTSVSFPGASRMHDRAIVFGAFLFPGISCCVLYSCTDSRWRSCSANRCCRCFGDNCCDRHSLFSYLFSLLSNNLSHYEHIFHIAAVTPDFSLETLLFRSSDRPESSIWTSSFIQPAMVSFWAPIPLRMGLPM